MAIPQITLAARDWDHLVPLMSGEIRSERMRLTVVRRQVTPTVLDEPSLDGGEVSFSRSVLAALEGDDRLVSLPIFVMRGFRQRCVLVRSDSPLGRLEQLSGLRVGLTGWPDSGNTWTRAVIRQAGVELDAVEWFVGDLTAGRVDPRRLGDAPLPKNVRPLRDGASLTSALRAGELDAILTPFMPPGFFETGSDLRHLLGDYRAAERAYFARTGYVPGIHVIALRRELVEREPWLPGELVDVFDRSKHRWWQRRQLLADTTPWLLTDLAETTAVFGRDWMPYGLDANRAMIDDFCSELHRQGIADRAVSSDELFSIAGADATIGGAA